MPQKSSEKLICHDIFNNQFSEIPMFLMPLWTQLSVHSCSHLRNNQRMRFRNFGRFCEQFRSRNSPLANFENLSNFQHFLHLNQRQKSKISSFEKIIFVSGLFLRILFTFSLPRAISEKLPASNILPNFQHFQKCVLLYALGSELKNPFFADYA